MAGKDLIALVADKNMEFALRALLSRAASLEIRPVTADVYVHPERDAGCLLRAHEFCRPFIDRYSHSLVMFDREGCGRGQESRRELEQRTEALLSNFGWEGRSATVVIDPELEAWVWSSSPHVASALGWQGRRPGLREWLERVDLWADAEAKPHRPKHALERALWAVRRPRSSALYAEIAGKVRLGDCQDLAFGKLRDTLASWFQRHGR
ncbi:MAG: hypothetical protein AB1726_10260 [Planctomycetota bacterium]